MTISIELPNDVIIDVDENKRLSTLLKQNLALELYKNEKITLSQGAEILDIDIYNFIKLLSKHKIEVIKDYNIEQELESII